MIQCFRTMIDFERELNPEQLEVLKNGDGPVLVLAGAGSGTKRTITYRVAWLIENAVDPQNILLLTFTNKASREMMERVESLLGAYPRGLWGGTFHSIANRLLRKYAFKLGFDSNFTILDQEDARDLVGICVKELKIDTKNRRFPSNKVLHGLISYKSNKSTNIKAVVEIKNPRLLDVVEEIAQVDNLYKKLKAEQNSMDFDDLLLKFLELLEQNPDIREQLSNQFQYVLVDEFQDTNVIQAKIIPRSRD